LSTLNPPNPRYGGAVRDLAKPQDIAKFRVPLYGVEFDPIHESDVINVVISELAAGRGGRIITPNVDIMRRARREAEAREHIRSSTVVVADGTPLIWASKLAGRPLPARVPGSDLIWSLSGGLANHGRSVYLLGGEPGVAKVAASVLTGRFDGLRIAGHLSPPFGFDTRPHEYDEMCDEVVAAKPDLVFVGLGFPKQERVISRLRTVLPNAWFLGCGAAIGFVAGAHPRAPQWMQRGGLEWLHRLGREPQRLMRRYLMHDAPFAMRLLASSAVARFNRADAANATPAVAAGPIPVQTSAPHAAGQHATGRHRQIPRPM
jgi:N-acetylglucosaminyldiphosphoundecaprenol N-acetyl-beta-D-mannosaminyltransferase